METPSTSPGAPAEAPTSIEAQPERGDREVLLFLAREVMPALRDRAPRALREAVRRAVREQRLSPLERLSGRHRHELLIAIEHVTETRRRPAADVLVRLTTVVSGIPATPDFVDVSAARPAR
jgi:hypothetical protein